MTTLDSSSLIVPTARLAAAFRRRDARRRRADGAQAWRSPDVFSLGVWLTRASAPERCAGRLPAAGLLGEEQTQALWASVIAADMPDESGGTLALGPAQTESLARLMSDVERLVFAWELDAAWQRPQPLSFEQRLARRWYAAFRARCRRHEVVTRTMVLEACAARGVALAAPTAVSRGFEAAGPALRRVLPPPAPCVARSRAPAQVRICASVEDECDAALDWAHAARTAHADGAVAIVALDARSVDVLLARARHWRIAAGLDPGAPADLSAPLARLPTAPLVSHALLMLQSVGRIAAAEACALIASPFSAGARPEFAARARCAARLQAERYEPITRAELRTVAARGECPELCALLDGLEPLGAETRGRRPPAQWVAFVARWLAAWGWPGLDAPTPQERAAHAAWWRALDGAATLDAVLPPLRFSEFLARLRQIVREITDGEALAPDAAEVLALEEAAVLRPEAVWILGVHDAAWPVTVESNPLLPPVLLRRAGAPGSSAAADALRAEQQVAAILDGAHTATLSYAQYDGETPRRPSALLARLGAAVIAAPPLAARWQAADEGEALEAAPADAPVPIAANGPQHHRGGTGILAAQARCAFRAFALYRLYAEELEEAEPGVAPRLRGQIAHAAMAALWRDLGTQSAARARGAAGRARAIERAVTAALDEFGVDHPELTARRRVLEAQRLGRLLAQSLAADLERPPFEVVAIEAQQSVELAELSLTVRIDRVDRLEDGSELILDYKTGQARRKDWTLPRPLAPQLPVYALARAPAPLGGIGFAQLRPGDCRLITEPRSMPGEPQALAALRAEWRDELERLARAFLAGTAELDPRDGAKTCEECGLQPLCRVYERAPPHPAEAAADES